MLLLMFTSTQKLELYKHVETEHVENMCAIAARPIRLSTYVVCLSDALPKCWVAPITGTTHWLCSQATVTQEILEWEGEEDETEKVEGYTLIIYLFFFGGEM